ncbi:bifunctional lysylphosphatidylglycerol flippase/synthetase MprF [Bifidobacterium asteroides]|uniref:bifunctional lysylphosphatidylglycerol flippase/synthetase MprF n=1 Tax=Bifidobacterium asteroides TaxID=1684 RepID=UPI0020C58866|nr:phosphatidylglycerol lysyltransferase domain-containing protein [Bifidobacterium asteroides]MCP8614069.1 phosphatidylglycerol lysyltransferase domain-containing protein [Bifidobacterium asteroides]
MQTTNKGSELMEPSAKAVLLSDLAHWARRHALALAFSVGLILVNMFSWLFIWLLRIPGKTRLGMPLSDLIIRQAPGPLHGQARPSLLVQFARLLVSLVITPGPLPLAIDVALVLVMLCIAETRLGRRRTVLAAVISAIGGTAVGLIICWLINTLQDHWAWFIHVPMSLSPITLVVGSLMASIPFSDFLWRRRIATIGYTALILMVLYTGNPGYYCALAAALIGHLTGHLWHGPVQDANPHGHSGSYETRHLLGAVATVLALGPLVTVSSRIRAGFFTPLGTFMGSNTGGSAALSRCLAENNQVSCYAQYGLVAGHPTTGISSLIMPTLVMLVVAWGIYHGRRVAAVTGVVLNALTVVLALLYFLVFPLTIGEGLPQAIRHGALPSLLIITLPPLILSWFLVRNLGIFLVRTKTSRLQLGWAAIVLAFLATAMGYMAFTAISPRSFNPWPTTGRALSQLPELYLPNGVASRFLPTLVPRTPTGRIVTHGIGLIFWLVVLVVLLSWMRSSVIQNGSERQEADKLVEYGGESMSFMTTWEGNSYWFSPSGRSANAYRLLHSIALTTTGPFGDPDEYADDLDEFTRFCNAHSWSPVFYSVHKPQRDLLAARGWSTLTVGTEMVVTPSLWQTKGKKWQDIRTAINKAKRDNITDVLTTFNDASWDVQSQIVDISEQWAELKALPEMKFTLGGLDELRDPRMAILYAVDDQDKVLAVTSWMPTYRQGQVIGWTLDFMRHRTDSPNGIMEFLIARMAERLRDQGTVEFMSLSAAPLAGMDSSEDRTAFLQHALHMVADLMEPAYGFRSLFFFKKKFQPSEHPVYICYPDPAQLAQIGLAVVQAYLPNLKASQAWDAIKTIMPKSREDR